MLSSSNTSNGSIDTRDDESRRGIDDPGGLRDRKICPHAENDLNNFRYLRGTFNPSSHAMFAYPSWERKLNEISMLRSRS